MKIPQAPQHNAWALPEFLFEATCVVVAALSTGGRLLYANRGLQNILGKLADGETRDDLRGMFINPTFEELLTSSPDPLSGHLFEGVFTLGWPDQPRRSFRAVMFRIGERLLLYAEHDVVDHARLNNIVMRLNDGLIELQHAALRKNRQLKRQEQKIEELVVTDQLTGIANRRGFDIRIKHEIDRARRVHRPLSILMADIDRFKDVNDSFGHTIGDRVLQQVADVLRSSARNIDFVARYGGEEFIMLLPESTCDSARDIAERIRRRLVTAFIGPIPYPVTISIGVAQWREPEDELGFVSRADAALYQSKQQGRNRVSLAV